MHLTAHAYGALRSPIVTTAFESRPAQKTMGIYTRLVFFVRAGSGMTSE